MSEAYLHSYIAVVRVYPGAEILVGPLTQEVFDKFVTVLEVVSAATPLPGFAVLQIWSLVTGAALHAASAAGFCHGMGKAS